MKAGLAAGALVAALLLAACRGEERRAFGIATVEAGSGSKPQARDCPETFDPARDYFPAKVRPSRARYFSVRYGPNWKRVELRPRAADGRPQAVERLLLVQCGTPPPPLEGDLAGAFVVEVPARTVAANGDSDAARLVALGLGDRIVALGSGGIYDPGLRRRWERREIAAIGASFHGAPNYESLLALSPDLLLMFTADPSFADALARARRLGLPAVATYAWAEQDFLAQAEWIKFVALFFNAEAEAERYFSGVSGRYLALSARARAEAQKPGVFWGGPDEGDRWWVEKSGPEAQLLEDAGGLNLLADPKAEPWAAMDTGAVIETAGGAELWITGSLSDQEWRGRVPLEAFRAWRDRRVFHFHKRTRLEHDAYDWYETAMVRPDEVLADLVTLLHPALAGERMPGRDLVYFAPIGRSGEGG